MATKANIVKMIMGIKMLFPYYNKDLDENGIRVLVDTWASLLQDYPDKAVSAAFANCLKTCKMPPTPADVIEQLNNMAAALEPTTEELWSIFTKALNKVERELHYLQYPIWGETPADAHKRIQKIWDELPERIKQYIGSKGELMRISRDYTDNDLKFEKNRFDKAMLGIKSREGYSVLVAQIGSSDLNALKAHGLIGIPGEGAD